MSWLEGPPTVAPSARRLLDRGVETHPLSPGVGVFRAWLDASDRISRAYGEMDGPAPVINALRRGELARLTERYEQAMKAIPSVEALQNELRDLGIHNRTRAGVMCSR